MQNEKGMARGFLRYSWVESLRENLEACDKMERLCKRLQNEKREFS